ncbi:MAG: hypothetical protein AB2A00_42410 [Myxococcota bacterium]
MLDVWEWGLSELCTPAMDERWRTSRMFKSLYSEMLDYANAYPTTVYGARARLEAARLLSYYGQKGEALRQVKVILDGPVESEKTMATYYLFRIMTTTDGHRQEGREGLGSMSVRRTSEYWRLLINSALDGIAIDGGDFATLDVSRVKPAR